MQGYENPNNARCSCPLRTRRILKEKMSEEVVKLRMTPPKLQGLLEADCEISAQSAASMAPSVKSCRFFLVTSKAKSMRSLHLSPLTPPNALSELHFGPLRGMPSDSRSLSCMDFQVFATFTTCFLVAWSWPCFHTPPPPHGSLPPNRSTLCLCILIPGMPRQIACTWGLLGRAFHDCGLPRRAQSTVTNMGVGEGASKLLRLPPLAIAELTLWELRTLYGGCGTLEAKQRLEGQRKARDGGHVQLKTSKLEQSVVNVCMALPRFLANFLRPAVPERFWWGTWIPSRCFFWHGAAAGIWTLRLHPRFSSK